jgi:hypothetical protein
VVDVDGDVLAMSPGMPGLQAVVDHSSQTYNDLSLLLFWVPASGATWGDAAGDGFDAW